MHKKISAIKIFIFAFFILIASSSIESKHLTIQYTPQNSADSHLITNVSYIAQSEGYFCYYSCITMILNYYGFNTSLDEILFLDGLGYSHYYYPEGRLPEEGCYSDINYVFSLFGIEQNRWNLEHDLNNDQNWDQYLTRLKENISANIPLITSVNPFALPSLRNQFPIPDFLWNLLFPPGFHMILIIGYNMSNTTICYQDPNAGFYGKNSHGSYAWMSLSDFRNATEQVGWGRYHISTLIQTNTSFTSKQRFEQAMAVNKLKMEGNYTGYYLLHGINASIQLKTDYSPGQQNLTTTINLYQQDGAEGLRYTIIENLHKLFSKIRPDCPNVMSIYMIGEENPFLDISQEKNHVADYLQNNSFYIDLSLNQSQLLRQEADKWLDLAQQYKIFLRKGFLISHSKSEQIMFNMDVVVTDIIFLESSIIQGIQ